jgi:predicted ATPase
LFGCRASRCGTKSMVATRPISAMMRYRLLDTTRAYALEIRVGDVELADLAVRHATYRSRCFCSKPRAPRLDLRA